MNQNKTKRTIEKEKMITEKMIENKVTVRTSISTMTSFYFIFKIKAEENLQGRIVTYY